MPNSPQYPKHDTTSSPKKNDKYSSQDEKDKPVIFGTTMIEILTITTVGGVPHSLTERDLNEAFRKFGYIVKINLKYGFAFVVRF